VGFNVALLLWIFISSLKRSGEIFSRATALLPPTEIQWGNYVDAWQRSEFGTALFNTVLVVVLSAVVVVALGAPAAYVLSRTSARSAHAMTTFFVVGMGIPLQAIVIPIFVMMNTLGLVNSLFGLGVIYVAISLPFTVFLLTGFFRTLPTEVEEAAAIDGASGVRTLATIMLPMAQPGIVTAFTLNVVLLWNETLLVLMLVSDSSQFTLPRALLSLNTAMQYTGNWGGLFAGVVIVAVPIIVIFFVLSQRIIEGMTLGVNK
jgi:N-acetylglucosamine transport system permease protein